MRRIPIFLSLPLVLFALALARDGLATSPEPSLDGWVAAHNAGDLEGLVNAYAADAVLLPPDGSILRGHDAVRAAFGPTVAAEGVRLERIAGWRDAALAVELGTWEHFTREDGRSTATGTYTVVWRLEGDGEWRIVENGWAVAAPAAEAAE